MPGFAVPGTLWESTKCCESEVAQLCLTLCNPMDYSLPGSSVHGISQARILEWVALSFSRGSSQPRDWTQVTRIAGRRFTVWATRETIYQMLDTLRRITTILQTLGMVLLGSVCLFLQKQVGIILTSKCFCNIKWKNICKEPSMMHVVLMKTSWRYYPHFTGEETEAQRRYITWLETQPLISRRADICAKAAWL